MTEKYYDRHDTAGKGWPYRNFVPVNVGHEDKSLRGFAFRVGRIEGHQVFRVVLNDTEVREIVIPLDQIGLVGNGIAI